jgi:hypothetical protein
MFQAAWMQSAVTCGLPLPRRSLWIRRQAVRISGTAEMPMSTGSSAVPSQRWWRRQISGDTRGRTRAVGVVPRDALSVHARQASQGFGWGM